MADVLAINLWQCDVIGRCYSHDAISLQLNKYNESKNCRAHQHCDTIMCWKCLRLTFSSDLEKAMFDTGKSLSTIKKIGSVLEKIN